ncbi:MexH family multidrug efflux RND transporter periplasmic adaptor subunit [Thalassotalea loyana]|uniref:MexH family multidrug efflux RND transporter periplasmic adaptor subunit n=1 Tax=Thalassotalea loyana TaxID=280483 RepID=A0ABQ6HCG4_9GAMM|nr:efflux RND transporter periplasmic adaptor subunit [Thalassotalea loyana]GLX84452.1 MexH family multidrug efflux RND transporter periplasmic adaptor subunit [Thalassotalea loyana]
MSKSISNRLPLIILAMLLVGVVAYLQWPQEVKQQKRGARTVSVKTALAQVNDFKDTVESLGSAIANEQVFITSKSSDLVEQISFEDGQAVKAGQVLVRLNSQEENAKVKELEANLAESVAQLNRLQDLYKKKATSKSVVEEQEAKTKAIGAQLMSAKTKLFDLTIKAPFDGVLGFREISLGAYISAGDVITSLDDLSQVKVDFNIPERFFTTLKVGQKVEAKNAAYDEVFTGKISSIDSRIDPTTRMVKVRALIPNDKQKLRAGMLLKITVERQVEQVLMVPESAIIPIENDHFVFTISEGKAKKTQVTIGRRQPGVVEILNGLNEGQGVVTEGALKLRDGSAVNVLE